jgi:signal transduction histidine kinase
MKRASLRYLLAVAGAFVLTILLTAWLMQPPQGELIQLSLVYGAATLASVGLGFLTNQSGLWRRLGSLTGALTLGYVGAAVLTLITVWVIARLMFLSQHDLALAGVLLLFASGLSVSFGYLFSQSLTRSVWEMAEAAERISMGDFSARVPEGGKDEIAKLADAFNQMAHQLEMADVEAESLKRARRDFVAWVSHDLRTPLTSLRAMIDALADGVVTEKEIIAQYLALSQGAIDRLSSLIDDLFELSRLDSGHVKMGYEMCSLADLVSDAVGSISPRALAKSIRVSAEVEAGIDPMRIAPRQVERALHNLLDNGLHHTPEGGEIHVSVTLQGSDVKVKVQDSGPGISEGELDLVFERFYRGEASRSREDGYSLGAGLGLAIARGMVEAHGGRIWAEPGRSGGIFCFTLPKVVPVSVEGGEE